MKQSNRWIYLFIPAFTWMSCYGFKGSVIPDHVKTFTIQDMEIRSSLAPVQYAFQFTEDLKSKIRRETGLKQRSESSDIIMKPTLIEYEIKYIAPTANRTAASNQLNIVIEIEYQDTVEPKNNWKQQFRSNQEYGANELLSSIQDQLHTEINKLLLDQIFDKAFNNW